MSENDESLVRKAQGGDRAAFEELIRRTSRLVFARLYLETGSVERAEDLVQETWLSAYRSLHRLQYPEHLRPWLLTIAQNALVDAIRRDARQKRSANHGSEPLNSVPDAAPTPAQDAEQAEERLRVLAVLRSLPEEYRIPLTLRYIAGADYQTIETQLGLTNGSLRGLLHRGLNLLRTRLGVPDTGKAK